MALFYPHDIPSWGGITSLIGFTYYSGHVKINFENSHLYWIYPLKIVIFHSYVSLPEGTARSLLMLGDIFSSIKPGDDHKSSHENPEILRKQVHDFANAVWKSSTRKKNKSNPVYGVAG